MQVYLNYLNWSRTVGLVALKVLTVPPLRPRDNKNILQQFNHV